MTWNRVTLGGTPEKRRINGQEFRPSYQNDVEGFVDNQQPRFGLEEEEDALVLA